MNDIKFSFIVPVYNVEQYLARCVDSLFGQTYRHFEVICVDDGSTDNSSRLLESLSAKYPAMAVVHQENRGLGEARNAGVAYAHGDYIWFVDSDDWIEPNALEALAGFIAHEDCPDIVLFDILEVLDNKSRLLPQIVCCSGMRVQKEEYLQYLLLHKAHYFGWGKVFKSSVYLKSGFRFPVGFYEDVALLGFYKKHVNTIGYLYEGLYNYYIRCNSIMRTYDKRILDVFERFAALKDVFNEPEWKKSLASFFYTFSITKKKQAELAADKQVLADFWKIYKSYQKDYGYVSGCGLFNPYITIGAKIKMLLRLILRF